MFSEEKHFCKQKQTCCSHFVNGFFGNTLGRSDVPAGLVVVVVVIVISVRLRSATALFVYRSHQGCFVFLLFCVFKNIFSEALGMTHMLDHCWIGACLRPLLLPQRNILQNKNCYGESSNMSACDVSNYWWFLPSALSSIAVGLIFTRFCSVPPFSCSYFHSDEMSTNIYYIISGWLQIAIT